MTILVPGEVADVDASEMMNFASYPVLGESPKFVDLQLSAAHTADTLKTVFFPATRSGGLTDNSDGIASGMVLRKLQPTE